MKLVFISDTHSRHRDIAVPAGDILIHAGDATMQGEPLALRDFNDWLGTLPHEYKIFVPGNHDLTFDPDRCRPSLHKFARAAITHATVLIDQGISIAGWNFWGSPVTPWFHGEYWAFNRRRGNAIAATWKQIPRDTDVLVTHGPPQGVLDTIRPDSEHLGCYDLALAVSRLRPRVHCFGHIHGAHGRREHEGTTFINAATLDEAYQPYPEAPYVLTLERNAAQAAVS